MDNVNRGVLVRIPLSHGPFNLKGSYHFPRDSECRTLMSFPMPGPPWLSIYSGALILCLCTVGLYLALGRDRSRGRKRCPRCWYDLSSSVTKPFKELRCSECGHVVKVERRLYRTRRHWRWAVLSVLIMPAGVALPLWPQIREKGWTSVVPTDALLLLLPRIDGEGSAAFRIAEDLVARPLNRRQAGLLVGATADVLNASHSRTIRWTLLQHLWWIGVDEQGGVIRVKNLGEYPGLEERVQSFPRPVLADAVESTRLVAVILNRAKSWPPGDAASAIAIIRLCGDKVTPYCSDLSRLCGGDKEVGGIAARILADVDPDPLSALKLLLAKGDAITRDNALFAMVSTKRLKDEDKLASFASALIDPDPGVAALAESCMLRTSAKVLGPAFQKATEAEIVAAMQRSDSQAMQEAGRLLATKSRYLLPQ